MPLVPFPDLLAGARHAVGYFESWSLESLLAVADAAEAQRAPVILGFSGIYLPHPDRLATDQLAPYASMALAVCHAASVPTALLFNESPNRAWVSNAVRLGFNAVMYSNDAETGPAARDAIAALVHEAHAAGVAVEAEMEAVPGVAGGLIDADAPVRGLTDPDSASAFVECTGIDALAINVGQKHLHGRSMVGLDLRLVETLAGLPVPLVLHGASSVERDDLVESIKLGVAKINVGSRLKQAYFGALRQAAIDAGEQPDNPYETIGSGLAGDVLMRGRLAMQREVERLMALFGSSGRA
jgi:fructose/tagatose bisphosphate aldolase